MIIKNGIIYPIFFMQRIGIGQKNQEKVKSRLYMK